MKILWGKPVHVIPFIRTLLVTLSVAVCLATLMGCGNTSEEDASYLGDKYFGDKSPADDIPPGSAGPLSGDLPPRRLDSA